MNRGRGNKNHGYTIVETLIFLAVSGLMFLMAMQFLNGQQAKNEFTAAVRDTQTKLDTIINNVGTGYYRSPGDFSCDGVAAGKVHVTAGGDQLGSKGGCVFVGRVIQLAPSGNTDSYSVYSAIGRQYTTGTNLVTSLSDSYPVLLAKGAASPADYPDSTETDIFGGGLTVKMFKINGGASNTDLSKFFVGFFGSFDQSVDDATDTQMRVNVVAPSGVFSGLPNFVDQFNTLASPNPPGFSSHVVVDKSVSFCVQSDASVTRHAWINIGAGSSGSLTTSTDDIGTGACS